MLGLRYVAGAIPGKSLKRKTTESDDKQNKRKKYEENRKARKFNVKWLTNREWLDYDESNDIMTCKTVLTYMNIQKNNILHLNCIHFFSSSKKWFGPVKVLPLMDQMSSEVQGTFGMTVIDHVFKYILLLWPFWICYRHKKHICP
jgi:hypothetical protein